MRAEKNNYNNATLFEWIIVGLNFYQNEEFGSDEQNS